MTESLWSKRVVGIKRLNICSSDTTLWTPTHNLTISWSSSMPKVVKSKTSASNKTSSITSSLNTCGRSETSHHLSTSSNPHISNGTKDVDVTASRLETLTLGERSMSHDEMKIALNDVMSGASKGILSTTSNWPDKVHICGLNLSNDSDIKRISEHIPNPGIVESDDYVTVFRPQNTVTTRLWYVKYLKLHNTWARVAIENLDPDLCLYC